jgi:diguanylate cyclase (GGDEF)-like protein
LDALHSDLMDELYRKADADLVTRSGIGGFVFPMLLLLIGLTTGYRAEHPTLFGIASGAVGISLAIRIALKSSLSSLSALPRYRLLVPLIVAICLTTGSASLLYVTALASDGLTSWICVLLLIQLVGIATGSTIAFTPNFALMASNVVALLGPAALFGLVRLHVQGIAFALCTAVMLTFLLLQGRWLHKMYWDLLTDRSLEEIRLQEVDAARASAEAAHKEALYHATHDALTTILNRREVMSCLEIEQRRALRNHDSLSVLMLDIDHFKNINEAYGHLAGDQVIRAVVERLKDAVREKDVIGRVGGEEFLVILPGCDAAQIAKSAERMRSAVACRPISAGELEISVTVSIGAVFTAPTLERGGNLLSLADHSLYEAKHQGGNRVVAALD